MRTNTSTLRIRRPLVTGAWRGLLRIRACRLGGAASAGGAEERVLSIMKALLQPTQADVTAQKGPPAAPRQKPLARARPRCANRPPARWRLAGNAPAAPAGAETFAGGCRAR